MLSISISKEIRKRIIVESTYDIEKYIEYRKYEVLEWFL